MLSRFNRLLIAIFLIITSTTIQCSDTYFAIEQCPGIDVPNIRHQTQYNEISMIFYYTQWSDESLDALQEYNDVAEYFGDKVYSAAIDCWHLACNCSKTLTTTVGSGSPHKWPTLIVYYGRRGQLKMQYNGLYTFRDIIQFMGNIMQPLERVENRKDLDKMTSLTDAVIFGAFKNPNCIEYKQYLIASLKWLEHDPIRTYRFAVNFASGRTKNSLNDTENVQVPNLFFMGHKTKKSFIDFRDFKWNSSYILRWLQEDLSDDNNLLHGYTTPIMIAQKMKKQPVLAIFVNQPQQFFQYMEKYVNSKQPFTKAENSCKKLLKTRNINEKLKSTQINKTIQNIQIFSDETKCYYNYKTILQQNLQFYYEINFYVNELFQKSSHSAKLKSLENPSLEIFEILDFFHSTNCLHKINIALQTSLHIGVVKRLEGYILNEQECKSSNRSLSVVLLDTQRYKDYLENIDVLPTPQSMATVFIIDKEKENIYLMDDRYAMYNLMEFVKKFYTNNLNNYFKNNKNILPTFANASSKSIYDTELKHLNRHIFLNYLQYTHNQTLIVLIYSPDCALCGNIQHAFIQLSLSLRNVKELQFIRINAMNNDLPWQYNMPFLPTLLVFPKNRFSESRIFPMHLKPDVRTVFGFILNQLLPHDQVRVVLSVCQSGTLPTGHSQSCWQFAKTLLMQHIGKHLQYWQIFEAERSLIFDRLRAFKDMTLDIQRNLRL